MDIRGRGRTSRMRLAIADVRMRVHFVGEEAVGRMSPVVFEGERLGSGSALVRLAGAWTGVRDMYGARCSRRIRRGTGLVRGSSTRVPASRRWYTEE